MTIDVNEENEENIDFVTNMSKTPASTSASDDAGKSSKNGLLPVGHPDIIETSGH